MKDKGFRNDVDPKARFIAKLAIDAHDVAINPPNMIGQLDDLGG